ncbi:hypothetical protein EVAR_29259_1 [Eumeta japonica]|uniref:Uncharacterized protein n=1 Tax=Eumeta variegata TaxID=151549 RepID=A0A4C1VKR2_EUMVA|nr:hypothetical protein EVAR_29259_1 [Eumeta japonica]
MRLNWSGGASAAFIRASLTRRRGRGGRVTLPRAHRRFPRMRLYSPATHNDGATLRTTKTVRNNTNDVFMNRFVNGNAPLTSEPRSESIERPTRVTRGGSGRFPLVRRDWSTGSVHQRRSINIGRSANAPAGQVRAQVVARRHRTPERDLVRFFRLSAGFLPDVFRTKAWKPPPSTAADGDHPAAVTIGETGGCNANCEVFALTGR